MARERARLRPLDAPAGAEPAAEATKPDSKSVAPQVHALVLDRSRDLAVDVGCLTLAGLEMLVGPAGTVPVGVVVLLVRAATRVPAGWLRLAVAGFMKAAKARAGAVPPCRPALSAALPGIT